MSFGSEGLGFDSWLYPLLLCHVGAVTDIQSRDNEASSNDVCEMPGLASDAGSYCCDLLRTWF